MTAIVILTGICYLCQAVWRSILKEGAYPQSIDRRLKVFHALALCYLGLYFGLAVLNVLRVLQDLPVFLGYFSSQSDPDPTLGAIFVASCVSGLFLPKICDEMAKRKRKALKWFFVVWPICFLTTTFTIVPLILAAKTTFSFVEVLLMLIMFFATIVFYARGSVRKVLFEQEGISKSERKNV